MNYLNFRNNPKTNLSEYNLDEMRGWTIETLYHIETKIDAIISNHFNPEKKDAFDKIILHSSIISIGAKTKILRNIPSFEKNIIGKIQKLVSIRNSFAHSPLTEDININLTTDISGKINTRVNPISRMEVMASNGEIKKRDSRELILEFIDLNKDIRIYLDTSDQDNNTK